MTQTWIDSVQECEAEINEMDGQLSVGKVLILFRVGKVILSSFYTIQCKIILDSTGFSLFAIWYQVTGSELCKSYHELTSSDHNHSEQPNAIYSKLRNDEW